MWRVHYGKKILALASLLVIIAAFLISGCGGQAEENSAPNASKMSANSSLTAIKDRGVLRVAVFKYAPPLSYKTGDGKWAGFDIDLAKRMAKDLLGSEDMLQIVPVDVADSEKVLVDGHADLVLANFTITKDRSQNVDLSALT